MRLLAILASFCLFWACASAFIDQMNDEDKEWLEQNLDLELREFHGNRRVRRDDRQKREVGVFSKIRFPTIDFSKFPRLDVVTLEHHPYTFVSGPVGDRKYQGFIIDLIYVIARRLGVFVRFYEPQDGRFGSESEEVVDGKKVWTGMIGEVIARENSIDDKGLNETSNPDEVGKYGADIAAAPITITSKREEVVDFVKPFQNLGLTVLLKKPDLMEIVKSWPYDFSLTEPLSPQVWVCGFVSMLVVWLFLWMMNRYNPYEFGERRRRNLATEEEGALFSMMGALWFTFTLFNWQGYDRSPRSVASRIISCFWMMFVTIFLVVYTGSYMNQLFWASTVHQEDPTLPPIRSLADLVSHKEGFTYGSVKGGSTWRYLTEVAKGEEFNIMKSYLNSEEGQKQMVTSFDEGVAKVREGKYGFIAETISARYIINTRPCDLTSVDHFGMRSYGLAVPNNSPYLEKLHSIILEMTENGDIEALEERWFDMKGECWNETVATKIVSKTSALFLNKPKRVNMREFWSVMILMIIGFFLALITFVTEVLWYKYRGRYSSSNRQRTQQLTNDDDGHI